MCAVSRLFRLHMVTKCPPAVGLAVYKYETIEDDSIKNADSDDAGSLCLRFHFLRPKHCVGGTNGCDNRRYKSFDSVEPILMPLFRWHRAR